MQAAEVHEMPGYFGTDKQSRCQCGDSNRVGRLSKRLKELVGRLVRAHARQRRSWGFGRTLWRGGGQTSLMVHPVHASNHLGGELVHSSYADCD
jgi:hypothetical protein